MIRDWLTKPILASLQISYLELKPFSVGGNTGQEFNNAVAELNAAVKEFSANRAFSDQYLDLIHRAEAHAAQQRWGEAQQRIWEAEFLINRARESRGTAPLRRWIACSLLIWLIVLAALGLLLKAQGGGIEGIFGITYWRYLLMGALGGITIALWGLVKHTTDLNFDVDFTLWYLLRPALGAISGLVAILVVKAGLFAINGPVLTTSEKPLYVLAFLAGFSERFFVQVIDRVMTSLLGGGSTAPSKTPATPIASSNPPASSNKPPSNSNP